VLEIKHNAYSIQATFSLNCTIQGSELLLRWQQELTRNKVQRRNWRSRTKLEERLDNGDIILYFEIFVVVVIIIIIVYCVIIIQRYNLKTVNNVLVIIIVFIDKFKRDIITF
jgi:hypothetical protein